jgi:hypothetical protein
MMMLECPEGGTPEHTTWLAALSKDEQAVVDTPVGRLFELLVIAYIKHAIERTKMERAERAFLLEKLNALPDGSLTVEMLATIQPMSDTEVAIYQEARSLDPKDDKCGEASFKMLTNLRVFSHFINLNPSLLTAIKMCPHWGLPGRTGDHGGGLA